MWFQLNSLFCSLILFIQLNTRHDTGVEASRKHAEPLGTWFNSIEQQNQENEAIMSNVDQIETTTQYKKKHRKKRFKKKEAARKPSEEVKLKKKRKKKEKKFMKTILRERDGEYNASSSIENDGHRKPVDIIVHIKMHD